MTQLLEATSDPNKQKELIKQIESKLVAPTTSSELLVGEYLLSKFNFPTEEIKELIKNQIDIFEKGIGFDNESFTYGGKRRRLQQNTRKNTRKKEYTI